MSRPFQLTVLKAVCFYLLDIVGMATTQQSAWHWATRRKSQRCKMVLEKYSSD